MEIAYILIHYGGADISACTYDGLSPTSLAVTNGCWKEWIIVLKCCGYKPRDVWLNELKRLQKFLKIGNGDSTAVDSDELLEPLRNTVIRRNSVKGDRHID